MSDVSCPMVISSRQTSAPPTASVSAAASVSVRPTAGSNAASHFCASNPASPAAWARRSNSRAARCSCPSARSVRTAATVSWTCSFMLEKRSRASRDARWMLREMK